MKRFILLLTLLTAVVLLNPRRSAAATDCNNPLYIVQAGDNLGRIAWLFDVALSALIKENDLKDYTDYFVGQRLTIPFTNCNQHDDGYQISYRERFGVAGKPFDAAQAYAAGLKFGSFIEWKVADWFGLPPEVNTSWQLVRVDKNGPLVGRGHMRSVMAVRPGSTWIIGNEPDIEVQDNLTAQQYARFYHELYHFIKQEDPTAKVAIAGVASPTPLRRAYLDQILNEYWSAYGEKMPIDVWTVHVYILREERDSWGMGIPPGMEHIDKGALYLVEDHNDLNEVQTLIIDFRTWLAERGYRDTPLAITEMGILMPSDFGFTPPVVAEYMHGLIQFLLSAKDADIGFPADDNRLVQQWFWYNLYDGDGTFTSSDLLDKPNDTLTYVGWNYASYLRELASDAR